MEFARSEGLGVASFDMFVAGMFSSDRDQPHQVDGELGTSPSRIATIVLEARNVLDSGRTGQAYHGVNLHGDAGQLVESDGRYRGSCIAPRQS